ncbi:early protein E4 [Tadarida brasiliensis papillomavirus 1]|uniref:Early protein E4 n=1 Tax=Tadarida brasiliensis papillomavirus 1 TaxID=2664215 RepID=A0A5Q2F023_9PAPI|nr:early protein E4 [Tadarida brasiliensis papillomavirus 1]
MSLLMIPPVQSQPTQPHQPSGGLPYTPPRENEGALNLPKPGKRHHHRRRTLRLDDGGDPDPPFTDSQDPRLLEWSSDDEANKENVSPLSPLHQHPLQPQDDVDVCYDLLQRRRLERDIQQLRDAVTRDFCNFCAKHGIRLS